MENEKTLKEQTDVSKLTLNEKIEQIRGMAAVVKKTKAGYNYKYVDKNDILAMVTAGLDKYHVLLLPSIVPGTLEVSPITIKKTRVDKAGTPYEETSNEYLVKADVLFELVNIDDPTDTRSLTWCVMGSQSDPSQAFGSGLTYCTRYFLTNFFQTAQTEQDPDEYRTKRKQAEDAENQEVLAAILQTLDEKIKKFVSEHSDKKEEVKTLCGKYATGSNYQKIKDPLVASKLLSEFEKKYLKGE